MVDGMKKMLQKRGALEGALLGALFNDILLIEEFKLKENLFIKPESKVYFRILTILLEKKIYNITDVDIKLHCPKELKDAYEDFGGFEIIENLKYKVSEENFESYLDDIQKQNYIIKLKDEGVDLEKPIEINIRGRIIRKTYFEIFNPMTCEECIAFMSNRHSTMIDYMSKSGMDEHSGHIDANFLEKLNTGDAMGTPMDNVEIEGETVRFMPYISRETLGFSPGTLSMIASFVNCGKSTFVTNLALSMVSKGERVLIICNESKIDDFHINFLSYILINVFRNYSLNKKRLKMGNFTEQEKVVINKAIEVYNKDFADDIHLVVIPDANMSLVESTIRRYVFSKDITCFMYDTLKMDFESGSEEDYKALIKDSRRLDKLTKMYDIIGITTAQLSQNFYGELCLDLNMLAGAKQMNEVLDTLIMFRDVFASEMNPESKLYMQPFQKVKDPVTGEWGEQEIELDKSQTYRMFFISKTRDGSTFRDTGTAVLTHFNGRSCTFQELCYCKPKRMSVNKFTR